jgi:16S rRNA (uracil1498-N3)-methyltransferase
VEVTPRTAQAHAFVGDLGAPRLDGEDRHHLVRVLRLADGAPVTAGDGRGRWRACRLEADGDLVPTGDVVEEPRPAPPITVAFALVKGERPELVVQKLTELGVDVVVPFTAARSVVRWDEAKALRNAGRFTTIARHAAMQSRRTWLPQVEPLADFARVAALPRAVVADASGGRPSSEATTVLVGPEGGWSDEERAHGLPSTCFGAHVLRSETAAITAGAVLVALRSGLVKSVSAAR